MPQVASFFVQVIDPIQVKMLRSRTAGIGTAQPQILPVEKTSCATRANIRYVM